MVIATGCSETPATPSTAPSAAAIAAPPSASAAPPPAPLHGQSLLDRANGFPRATLFRGPIEVAARRPTFQPADLLQLAQNYDLVLAKALDEEIVGLQRAAPYLQAIKARYPAKIVLDHFLFEGRNPLSTQPPVFAGHWLLLNGTTLTNDASATDTVLQVADSGVLRAGEAVQLTALDAAGKPDYAAVEQVKVVSVAAGRATVQRAAYGSTAAAFTAGRTRVAAHAWVQYGTGEPIWKYNFCLQAPRDVQGRRFIEALADTLAGYLRPGGPLAGLDGYQFDVATFFTGSANQGTRRLDCDQDGAADAGFVNGVSSYGLGAVSFMRALRGLVGDDIFLVSEATGDFSDRDTPYANGIENESFPDFHSWEHLSAAFQRYRYWLETARAPRLSYLQLKETSEAFTRCPEQDRGTNWRYRVALAAALMGTGYFAYLPINEGGDRACDYRHPVQQSPYAEPDELNAGRDDRWNYLGRPLEEPRRIERQSAAPNLLANGDFEKDASGASLATAGSARAVLSRDESTAGQGRASLKVSVTDLGPDPTDNKIRVAFGPFAFQQGKEYTLRLRARADPGYGRLDPAYLGVPRRVALDFTVAGVQAPKRFSGVADQLDLMADATWRDYSFSFVALAADARATLQLYFGQEPGDVWLDDLRLTEGGADIFVRRFERGAVLMNASASPVTFDLQALFPGVNLRRIAGRVDPVVNTGAPAGASVTVPARDALILLSGG
ncbi:MAG: hypothetical protein HY071_04705 [Chloroflexi bacterium]|nr:hypothetical protein [Chloroflexota bacterium]